MLCLPWLTASAGETEITAHMRLPPVVAQPASQITFALAGPPTCVSASELSMLLTSSILCSGVVSLPFAMSSSLCFRLGWLTGLLLACHITVGSRLVLYVGCADVKVYRDLEIALLQCRRFHLWPEKWEPSWKPFFSHVVIL